MHLSSVIGCKVAEHNIRNWILALGLTIFFALCIYTQGGWVHMLPTGI